MSVQKPNFLPAILILAGIVLLAAVGGLYAFSETDETIQGQADVTEYRVSSKVPGRVLSIRVREGQTVHAGDTLALLEAPDVQAKLSQAEAARDLRHTDEQADELIDECADFDALAEKVAEGCLPMDLEEALAEFIQCDEDIQIEAYEDWKSSHLPTSR